MQIAYVITKEETKNENFTLKIMSYILCFFLWPTMIFINFYKNKNNKY